MTDDPASFATGNWFLVHKIYKKSEPSTCLLITCHARSPLKAPHLLHMYMQIYSGPGVHSHTFASAATNEIPVSTPARE